MNETASISSEVHTTSYFGHGSSRRCSSAVEPRMKDNNTNKINQKDRPASSLGLVLLGQYHHLDVEAKMKGRNTKINQKDRPASSLGLVLLGQYHHLDVEAKMKGRNTKVAEPSIVRKSKQEVEIKLVERKTESNAAGKDVSDYGSKAIGDRSLHENKAKSIQRNDEKDDEKGTEIYSKFETLNDFKDEALKAEHFSKSEVKPMSSHDAKIANSIIYKYTKAPNNLMTKHSNLEIISASNVISTRNGFKQEPCIVLYCRCKSRVPQGEEMFPKQLHDYDGNVLKTDIRQGHFILCPNEGEPFFDQNSTKWRKELSMGHSIGHRSMIATCGLMVRVEEAVPYNAFLTVSHLFRDDLTNVHQAVNEKVVQPAEGEDPKPSIPISDADRICGTVRSCIFDDKADVGIDAALVEIDKNRIPQRPTFIQPTTLALAKAGFSHDSHPTYDDGSKKNASTLSIDNGATDRVIKFGRTTGLTKGTLRLNNSGVKITTAETNIGNSIYEIKGQLEIDSHGMDNIFIQEGDSGSAVFQVDKNNKLHAIGMAIGMTTYATCIVTPIDPILERLQHDLKSPVSIRTFDTDSEMQISLEAKQTNE